MAIVDYEDYKGIQISRDTCIYEDKTYLGNGQGCGTLWFKNVGEAHKFIDFYDDKIYKDDELQGCGLIPEKICEGCKGHYSFKTKEWEKATEFNCRDFKKKLVEAIN